MAMAAMSMTPLLVHLLLFSSPSSCQDLQEASVKWAQLYSQPALRSLLLDLPSLVSTALEEAMQLEAEMAPDGKNCTADLSTLLNNTQSVKMIGNKTIDVPGIALLLDAAGKPPAGLLQGVYSFRGNMEECQLITIHMDHSSEMYYGYLSLTLKSIETHQPVFPLPLKEELCLPSSCNASINAVLSPLNKTLLSKGMYADTTYTGYSMKGQPLRTEATVMIAVCSFILLLVVVSTAVDKLQSAIVVDRKMWRRIRLKEKCSGDPNVSNSEGDPLLGHNKRRESLEQFLKEVITAFSLYKNIPMILATHQPAAAINCLNGIRVISMFWVIMFHVYTFAALTVFRNMIHLGVDVLPRFGFQVIINGLLAVDSFFFLSGILTSYLTLREMRRRDGRFPLVRYYLHRIIRLTPTYMFVLFFFWFITMYLAQGTTAFQALHGPGSSYWENCNKYWWTNLLYINNFYPETFNDECMSWSWYLANDMQFFVISPLVIIPLFIWFPGGVIASGILLLTSFTVTGIISGYYNLPASVVLPLEMGPKLPENPDNNYLSQLYIKPYCLIGPFIIGLLLGAIFYHKYKPSFSKFVNWLLYLTMWVVAAAIGMAVVYGLYGGFHGHRLSLAEKVLYNIFSQTAWGVALALLVYACHHGYGGPINSFLSMPFWVPLSRLTFSAYLVHPIIVMIIFGSQRDTLYYTDVTMTMYIIGSVVLSYAAAGVVSVVVEFPTANVEMAVFKVLGVQLRESTRRVKMEREANNTNPTVQQL